MRLYRLLFETAADGIVFHELVSDTAQGRFIEANPAICRLLGYGPEEMRALTPLDLLAHDDLSQAQSDTEVLLREGSLLHEKVLITKDGRRIPVEIDTRRFERGGRQMVMSVIRDITERRRTEEDLKRRVQEEAAAAAELRRSEARFQLLSETASRLLSSTDPQAAVEELCTAVMKHLGCDCFFNFLAAEQEGRLHLNSCAGIPEAEARRIEWLEYGVAVCGCAAAAGVRIVAENIQEGSDPRTELVKSYGMQAYACHPLLSRGRVIGTLSFGTKTRAAFRDDELSLMKTVADQVAAAMDRIIGRRELEEAKNRLETALAAAKLAPWTTDLVSERVFPSPQLAEIFGVDADHELRTRADWRGFVLEEDRPLIQAAIDAAVRGDGRFLAEYRIRRPDGAVRWLRSDGNLHRDSRGVPRRLAGVVADITERKRAELELREIHEDLNRAQAVARTGSWRLDVRRNELLWSDENHRIFGIPRGTPLTYETFLGTVHPDDREYVDRKWTAALRGEPYDIEHRIVVNGAVDWVRERAELEFDSDGTLRGGFGTTQDVTEKKQAEAALRESEKRYRTLFNTMTEGFALHEVICDENGEPADYRYLEVNPGFERLTGLKAAGVVGRTVLEILPATEPYWIKRFGRVALTGRPAHFVEWSRALDRWYEVSAFQTEPGRFGVVFLDVTGRKRGEAKLKELNETLEARVAERTAEVQHQADLLRGLASELAQTEQRERRRLAKILHDHIQQLLVAARMQLEVAKRDPAGARAAATIQGADSIIKEAIDASRSLTVELSPPVLVDAGLIGGLNWLASRVQEQHQFKVHLRAENSAEPDAEETRFLLFDCARELVFNAVKHSGVSEAFVTLVRTDEDQARLVVRDEGVGFDPALLRNRRAGDASFGLFSIEQRLAHINGRLEVASAAGSGTTITLTVSVGTLPQPECVCPQHGMRQRGAAAVQGSGAKDKSIRVLLVDDHEILREGLGRLLQGEPDIQVVGEAADGLQAVLLAEKLRPDVVVMDVSLGLMSGVEATKAIVARDPRIRIIGLSMHVDKNVAGAMRNAGAKAYLTKGGPSEDLISAIRAAGSSA